MITRRYSRFFRKQNYCRFTRARTEFVDYKDLVAMKELVTETGKIIPSRITGTNANYQRQVATAIRRARYMAILPYCDQHKK